MVTVNPSVLWLVVVLSIFTLIYFSLGPQQRLVVRQRLLVRFQPSRATSGAANTPPRSLSPEKRVSNTTPTNANEYVDTLPPIQRDLLEKVVSSLPEEQRTEAGDLRFDAANAVRSLLKFEDDYRRADSSLYTPTGISVREVKALGDFPDYARLTDVPLPDAYAEHDVNKALPRPYRPFRWAYHQTMSLTKLETDWWIEIENTYRQRIQQRLDLYAKHGSNIIQWLPGSELACKETMEMVIQFLCARYPQHFALHASNTVFENKILGTREDVRARHPLLILFDHVPEDFAIMVRNPDNGSYYFRAGIICSSLGWTLGTKIGKQLHQIHAPIPDYKEKMQFSMERFFTKMPTGKPIQRGSWGLEVDQPLYMEAGGGKHDKNSNAQVEGLTLERCHLRVDWQTLRRLPLSGAVLFNFKALFTPVSDFRDEPGIPSIVLKVLNEGKENLVKYKNTWPVEHVVKPALEAYQREQVEKGLLEKDWVVQTLDEAPFYPGWEEKWHRRQGY